MYHMQRYIGEHFCFHDYIVKCLANMLGDSQCGTLFSLFLIIGVLNGVQMSAVNDTAWQQMYMRPGRRGRRCITESKVYRNYTDVPRELCMWHCLRDHSCKVINYNDFGSYCLLWHGPCVSLEPDIDFVTIPMCDMGTRRYDSTINRYHQYNQISLQHSRWHHHNDCMCCIGLTKDSWAIPDRKRCRMVHLECANIMALSWQLRGLDHVSPMWRFLGELRFRIQKRPATWNRNWRFSRRRVRKFWNPENAYVAGYYSTQDRLGQVASHIQHNGTSCG